MFKSGKVLIPVALFILSSCSVGPDYKKPEISSPAEFNNSNFKEFKKVDPSQADQSKEEYRKIEWWKTFKDEQLDNLIQKGFQNNLTIESAVANIKEARALRNSALLDFFPVIKSSAGYEDFRRSAAQIGLNNIPASSLERSLYSAGFDATWEIDIFGGNRRAYEANSATLEAMQANLDNVKLSIVAEIIRNYIELRGFQEQLSIANKNAQNQAETVKLTEALQFAGTGTELDTARARAQLNQTKANIPLFEINVEKAINRIAVLTGEQPQNIKKDLVVKKDIPITKAEITILNPIDAINNRPDVFVAERNLASATANIGVQISEYYPKINLIGSFTLISDTTKNFLSAADRVYSYGPQLSWTFLDFNRVTANVEGAKARTEVAYANYKEAILMALEDIENSLISFSKQNEATSYIKIALDQSKLAADLARERYKSGITDFLTVLDSEKRLLDVQTAYADALTKSSTALVAVYKAFGVGMER